MLVAPIFVIAVVVLYLWTQDNFPKFFLFPKKTPEPTDYDKFGPILAKYLKEVIKDAKEDNKDSKDSKKPSKVG